MQYGFVIDHDRCIGCHACTVACKAENQVPVGSFRTWVKYTEVGQFPDVRRHSAVLRCNHCSDAPCVTICPVKALEKRPDGIVDIDRDACIGCRACMQACPYDAIYLHQDLGKVEKCHYCAHRVEQSLEPACVVVCPEQAIVAGDLNDPESKVSLLVANNPVQVRRPEQGTGPNVHYKGADTVSLRPGAAMRPPMYLWSDRPPHKPEPWPADVDVVPTAVTTLDAGHRVEWGWPVAMYLVTKGIAGGVAMLAPFGLVAAGAGTALGMTPELLALLFLAITGGLLVEDLAHPRLFYRLLTRPNFSSWLVKGGIILGVFGAVLAATIVAQLIDAPAVVNGLRWAGAAVGAMVAGYTALLFAQCRGRDLWESRWLLPHLLLQALACGSVALLPFAPGSTGLKVVFAIGVGGHLVLSILEVVRHHETENARQAAGFLRTIRLGPLRPWRDGLIIGVGLAFITMLIFPAFTFVPALAGLYLYEHAYVRAAQLPPLS